MRSILLCFVALFLPCSVFSTFPFLINTIGTVDPYPAYSRDTVTQLQLGGYNGEGGSLDLFMYSGSFYTSGQQFLGVSGDAFISHNGGLSWTTVNSSITNSTTRFVSLPGLPSRYIDIPAGVWLLNGTMLLIAGEDLNNLAGNEVFYSNNNGSSWSLGCAAAPWSPRIRPATSVVRGLATPGGTYADESYIMCAGLIFNAATNDCWLSQSHTGSVWQKQTAAAPFANNLIEMAVAVIPFVPHSLIDLAKTRGVYYSGNSTIVIAGGSIGGYSGVLSNDVWRSTNLGVTWTHSTAAWSPRAGSSLLAYGSTMTISVNGSLVTASNSLLLIGGQNSAETLNDEGWLSFDQGVSWQQINSSTLPTLAYFLCAVSGNQIVTYGGFNAVSAREYLNGGLILSLPQSFLTPAPVQPVSSSSSSAPSAAFVSTASSSIQSYNVTASASSLISASWTGRVGARGVQQSLYPNAYLPAIYLIGGVSSVLIGSIWQSLDGGASWSPLGTNLTLSAIPTLQGSAVAVLQNNALVIYGGVLVNGTAISTVVASISLFTTAPMQYTAPFTPRYNHAYTTIPGTNTTLFCAGLTSTSVSTIDCWKATNPEFGVSSWTRQTASGPFPSSLANAALVTLYDANTTLLLCGGAVVAGSMSTAINTCWVSLTLGATWSAGITAAWGPRTGLVATSDLNDWAYVYGGQSTATSLYYYDLWVTTDRASTWTLVTLSGQTFSIQGGCLALYYTQQYISGGFITEPQIVFYAGYSATTGNYVQGSYFAPESIVGSAAVIPSLTPFNISSAIITSECQFTFNVAGTLAGFGVSSANPNPSLTASLLASLVGAVLGIPASAVHVCIHVTYAYLSTQRGEVYLYSGNLGNITTLVTSLTASTGTSILFTPTSIPITSAGGLVGPQSASLCIIQYALPGNVDYPWSLATSVQVVYNPIFITTAQGTAVTIMNGTGSRTYTNRFGNSFTTSLALAAAASNPANNLLYVGDSVPVDAHGISWNLSSAVQLPGGNPFLPSSLVTVVNSSGAVVENGSSRVDASGMSILASIPGFKNTNIGASNLNALAVNYTACQAPITFTNGLLPPTQPSTSNGGTQPRFSYFISDGMTYSVSTNLTLTTSSAFATTTDQLGNPYQTVMNITGIRTYTYLQTRATITSLVTGLYPSSTPQRFYPYALLSSSPGIYTTSSTPFFDSTGVQFSLSNTVPLNGAAPGVGIGSTVVSLRVLSTQLNALLVEGGYVNSPVASLQQQIYAIV